MQRRKAQRDDAGNTKEVFLELCVVPTAKQGGNFFKKFLFKTR